MRSSITLYPDQEPLCIVRCQAHLVQRSSSTRRIPFIWISFSEFVPRGWMLVLWVGDTSTQCFEAYALRNISETVLNRKHNSGTSSGKTIGYRAARRSNRSSVATPKICCSLLPVEAGKCIEMREVDVIVHSRNSEFCSIHFENSGDVIIHGEGTRETTDNFCHCTSSPIFQLALHPNTILTYHVLLDVINDQAMVRFSLGTRGCNVLTKSISSAPCVKESKAIRVHESEIESPMRLRIRLMSK
jgi:hypothetical protein